jgi:hypothetical protein
LYDEPRYTVDGTRIPAYIHVGTDGDTLSKLSGVPDLKMLDDEKILYATHIWDSFGTAIGTVVEDNHRWFVLTNKRFIKIGAGIIETAIVLNSVSCVTAHDDSIIFTREKPSGDIESNTVKMHLAHYKTVFYKNEINKLRTNANTCVPLKSKL